MAKRFSKSCGLSSMTDCRGKARHLGREILLYPARTRPGPRADWPGRSHPCQGVQCQGQMACHPGGSWMVGLQAAQSFGLLIAKCSVVFLLTGELITNKSSPINSSKGTTEPLGDVRGGLVVDSTGTTARGRWRRSHAPEVPASLKAPSCCSVTALQLHSPGICLLTREWANPRNSAQGVV